MEKHETPLLMAGNGNVEAAEQSSFPRLAHPVVLPLLVYVLAYIGTSILGATLLLTDFGQGQAKIFLLTFDPTRMQTFGSALYLWVLFAPLLLVPVFAAVGVRMGDAVRRLVHAKIADPSTGLLYALMVMFAGWCLYKIAITGYLIPELILDRTKNCDDRIIRRVELFAQLRYVFYAFVYAALPLVSTMFLIKGIRSGKMADFLCFFISFILIFSCCASIYMKTPFQIYFLLLLVGLLAAGLSWWKTFIIIGSLAAAVFVASSLVLDCTDYRDVATTIGPAAPAGQTSDVKGARPATGESMRQGPSERPMFTPDAKIIGRSLPIARNVVLRMAIAYPYYIEMFNNPAERCGVEDNRIPFLPKQTCFPASKVFSTMYPYIKHVQGQAPAAAHVSALAELGPWFSFVVMIGCGLAIGIAAQLARLCGPVLSGAMVAATAIFAYNLTQVPFVGALTYSQGFVVFLFPVALIVLAQQVWPALWRAILRTDGKTSGTEWGRANQQ